MVLIILIVLLFLLAIKPDNSRKEAFKPFEETYLAHRGLFNNKEDRPENSMPAFKAAVDHGYGIELDVQLTKDEKLVVFHDKNLKRACGVNIDVDDLTYNELKKYDLFGHDLHIPLFKDVLDLVRNKVPLMVEIKSDGNWELTSKSTNEALAGYDGDYCVISFNPNVVHWFKINAPQTLRGQLVTNYFIENPGKPFFEKFALTNLLGNFYACPDVICYNCKYTDHWSFWLCRKIYHPVTSCWTVKNEKELETAKKVYNIFVFEGFLPEK